MTKMIMAVLRPKDSDHSISQSAKIAEERAMGLISDDEAFTKTQVLVSSQEHTFVGLLGKNNQVMDTDGIVVDELRPGDTIVPYDQLITALETHDAEKATRDN